VDRAYQSWQRVKSLADSGKELLDGSWSARAEVLEKQIGSDAEDWQSAKEFDDIRLEYASLVDGKQEPDDCTQEGIRRPFKR